MATKKLQILDSLNKNAVLYTPQELTEEERIQVRENIGVPSLDENGKIPVSQLPDNIGGGEGGNIDLSDYYTKTESDTALSKKADLVNGKVPLSQLPDNIGSGGGASSWNDLKDKPFEEISPAQVITWDGNTDGLPSASVDLDMGDGAILTFACYKISDVIVTEELIKGTSFDCTTPDGSLSCEVDIVSEKTSNGSFYATNSQVEIPFIWVVNQDNDSIIYNGDPTFILTFPETGIWFLKGTVEGSVFMQINSLTVPAVIKTLDPKYIADMYYDTRKIYHFDSNKTPNPPSYPIPGFGVNGYKIFDLTPTLEEFLNYKIIKDGTTELTFANQQIILSWDGAWMIQSDTGYYFGLCLRSGTFEAEFQGMSVVCEVPEPGIYLMYNELPSNITFEINLGGELKQIDLKYLPSSMALGYDTRIRSYYSQAENPNPPQIDNAMLNMSGYKVSDLVPTKTEIFNSTKLIINEKEYFLYESGIQLETNDFIYVITSDGYFNFIFINKSGILNFTYSGYPMSFEIPEGGEGIYYQRALNAGVPEGRTIEFQIGDGELKQIDPKFIPADLDFNLDNYYTKSEVYSKSEVDSAIAKSSANINLSNYYTKNEVYTKSEVDTAIDKKEVDWENIQNKPIDENSVSITWNGNSSGKSAINIIRIERAVDIIKLVKVDDTPITNVVCGGQIHLNTNDTIDISPDEFVTISDNSWIIGSTLLPYVLNVLATDTIEIQNTTHTVQPGVYLLGMFNSDTALQATIYVSYCQIDTVKQLDPKFISLENYYTKEDVYAKNEVKDVHDRIDSRLTTAENNFKNYYTKSESNNRYYTKSEINNNHYTKQDVYTKSEIDTTLNNYYTKTNTYTKAEVDKTIGEINQAIGDINDTFDNYYTKDETYTKDEVYTKSEIDDVINAIDYSDYYTKSDVYNKSEIDTTVEGINNELNNRYVKSEVYTKGEVDATVEGINNAIDARYTKTEIDDGYYTKSDVYTKTEVDSTVEGINGELDNRYVKSDVYNKTEIDSTVDGINNAINNRYQKSEVYNKTEIDGKVEDINEAIDNRYTKADVYTKTEIDSTVEDINSELGNRYVKSDVYKKSEVDSKVEDINDAIDNRYTKADVYTKTEVDSTVDGINSELNNRYKKSEVYTKGEVDNKVTNVDNKFDGYYTKSNVYNKTEIDSQVNTINNGLNNRYTKSDVYTKSEVNNNISNTVKNYYTKSEIDDTRYTKTDVYNKTEIDSKINTINSDIGKCYTKSDVYNKSEVNTEIGKVSSKFNDYYTKSDIDSLIGDIGTVLDEINEIVGE